MSALTVRPVASDEEFAQHAFIASYAFASPDRAGAVGRRERSTERDWCIAAFDGAEMVAGLVIIPFEQQINGGRIGCGGIASVACLPERRRSGAVGGMLREALAIMRERGQWLSALYTPHFSLYRRYGWELANRIIGYTFSAKGVRLRRPEPRGRWRRVGADDWRELDSVHRAYAAPRNGGMTRDERWWRERELGEHATEGPLDAAIWSNGASEDRCYVIYRSAFRLVAPPYHEEMTLRVHDHAALDAEAMAAILAYLLKHDLSDKIVIVAGPDEPWLDVIEEPFHVEQRAYHGYMRRIVDVQRAIEARPALPQASGRSVTIAVRDASAEWNNGTWRIASSDGRIACERTGEAPQLSLDVCALAAIYNGYLRPAEAVRSGALVAHDPTAPAAASDIFSVSYAPWTPEEF